MSIAEAISSRSPSTVGSSTIASLKNFSCLTCQQRKVKCDRRDPCSTCCKSRVECVFRAPAPPRRRKRKNSPEADLLARLKYYEELLKGYGANIDSADGSLAKVQDRRHDLKLTIPEHSTGDVRSGSELANSKVKGLQSPGRDTGRLIGEPGMSKYLYLENNLWTGISDELRDLKQGFLYSSEDENVEEVTVETAPNGVDPAGGGLVFGSCTPYRSLRALHPQPIHIFRLWQSFLENVNPLVKLFHAPTVQQLILEAVENLDNVSKGTEALMFAIYFSAVTSLSNVNCESTFGEAKPTLLAKFERGVQDALICASFLKSSDLVILQAFVLFLQSVAHTYDPRSLWMLTGIAVRIGQRIGLHRDDSCVGLSFFEIEMRRRLWWPILILDSRTGQLSGSGTSVLANLCDTKLPLNINDSDLNPSMKDTPIEHTGTTEMVFCLVRYHVGEFLMRSKSRTSFGGSWDKLSDGTRSLADKNKAIDEFERLLEDKFLRYCDPSIPLAYTSAIMARSTVCKLRLVAHHPRQYPDKGESLTQKERDFIFSLSLKMIEYDNLFYSTKITKRFSWHAKSHFQLDAFVYAVSELLHHRITGNLAERAWQQIIAVFEHHPNMITDTKSALYVAVGTLTLRAWDSRDTTSTRQYCITSEATEPGFISALRSQRSANSADDAKDSHTSTASPSLRSAVNNMAGGKQLGNSQQVSGPPGDVSASWDPPTLSNPLEVDWSPVDWAYWDGLFLGYEP